MQQPIFLEPIFHEKIWGGNKLKQTFDHQLDSDQIGEAWTVSAHENGPTKVKSGPLQGKTLSEIWRDYPELFGMKESVTAFPLLIKIIDAHQDLSVQVHPGDTYAQNVLGEPFGKTECWYILDCKPGSEIIYGHTAQTREEFLQKVNEGNWDHLLNHVPVEKGDFFYVPSGTVHAIGAGIVLLEIQQSSDITYRVYDYDRKGADGNLRDLHLDRALDVINFPHQKNSRDLFFTSKTGELVYTRLIKADNFTVYHCTLTGETGKLSYVGYLLFGVLEGEGEIIIENTHYPLKKGDHFILPATVKEYELTGNMEFISSND